MPDLVVRLVYVSEYLEPALGTHAERCDAVSRLPYVALLIFACISLTMNRKPGY